MGTMAPAQRPGETSPWGKPFWTTTSFLPFPHRPAFGARTPPPDSPPIPRARRIQAERGTGLFSARIASASGHRAAGQRVRGRQPEAG
jgi:hypothetical protein